MDDLGFVTEGRDSPVGYDGDEAAFPRRTRPIEGQDTKVRMQIWLAGCK